MNVYKLILLLLLLPAIPSVYATHSGAEFGHANLTDSIGISDNFDTTAFFSIILNDIMGFADSIANTLDVFIAPAPVKSSGGSSDDSTAPVFKSGILSDTTTIIKTGKTTSFTFEFYENSGPQKIQHAEFVTAIDKTQKIYDSELFVEFDKSKEMVIVDKQSLWSTIPTVTIDDTGVNTKITFEMTFEKPMDVSDVILRVWDFKRNSVDERFENALQVIESKTTLTLPKDEIAENPVSPPSDDSTSVVTVKVNNYIKQWAGYDNTSITDKQLLEKLEIPGNNIPSWYSFNAKMVKEGKISVDEFVISLQNLSDRNILG